MSLTKICAGLMISGIVFGATGLSFIFDSLFIMAGGMGISLLGMILMLKIRHKDECKQCGEKLTDNDFGFMICGECRIKNKREGKSQDENNRIVKRYNSMNDLTKQNSESVKENES